MSLCDLCDFEIPDEATFCPQCGSLRSPKGGEGVAEHCEIAWRQGRFVSNFYAFGRGWGAQAPRLVMRSRRLRFVRGVPRLESRRARRAHQELVERLLRAGWKRAGQGVQWYGDRFSR